MMKNIFGNLKILLAAVVLAAGIGVVRAEEGFTGHGVEGDPWLFGEYSAPGSVEVTLIDGVLRIAPAMNYSKAKMIGYINVNPPWYDRRGEIRRLVVEEGIVSLMYNLCYSCYNLTEVQMATTVKEIGENCFGWCSSLTDARWLASLPITEIPYHCFEQCHSLVSVAFPSTCTQIGSYAFKNTGLVSVEWPESVMKIDEGVFRECTSLKSISFPGQIVEIGPEAFYGTALEEIDLSQQPLKAIPKDCFNYCDSLRTVRLPSSITEFDDRCFYGCTEVETFEYDGYPVKLGNRAFRSFTKIADSFELDLSSVIIYGGNVFPDGFDSSALDLSKAEQFNASAVSELLAGDDPGKDDVKVGIRTFIGRWTENFVSGKLLEGYIVNADDSEYAGSLADIFVSFSGVGGISSYESTNLALDNGSGQRHSINDGFGGGSDYVVRSIASVFLAPQSRCSKVSATFYRRAQVDGRTVLYYLGSVEQPCTDSGNTNALFGVLNDLLNVMVVGESTWLQKQLCRAGIPHVYQCLRASNWKVVSGNSIEGSMSSFTAKRPGLTKVIYDGETVGCTYHGQGHAESVTNYFLVLSKPVTETNEKQIFVSNIPIDESFQCWLNGEKGRVEDGKWVFEGLKPDTKYDINCNVMTNVNGYIGNATYHLYATTAPHRWNASAETNVVTVVCQNEICDLGGAEYHAALYTPDMIANGRRYNLAKIRKDREITDALQIVYYTRSGMKLRSAPVESGLYTAKFTLGGATAYSDFRIYDVVARIEDRYYETLQDAFHDVTNDNTTVYVITNFDANAVSEPIVVTNRGVKLTSDYTDESFRVGNLVFDLRDEATFTLTDLTIDNPDDVRALTADDGETLSVGGRLNVNSGGLEVTNVTDFILVEDLRGTVNVYDEDAEPGRQFGVNPGDSRGAGGFKCVNDPSLFAISRDGRLLWADEEYITTLPVVCRIDQVYFTTIQDAVDVVLPGETIVMVADVTDLTEPVTVDDTKDFTYDLDGHTVGRTITVDDPNGNYVFTNDGRIVATNSIPGTGALEITVGGDALSTGGGIFLTGGSLTLNIDTHITVGESETTVTGAVTTATQTGGTLTVTGGDIDGGAESILTTGGVANILWTRDRNTLPREYMSREEGGEILIWGGKYSYHPSTNKVHDTIEDYVAPGCIVIPNPDDDKVIYPWLVVHVYDGTGDPDDPWIPTDEWDDDEFIELGAVCRIENHYYRKLSYAFHDAVDGDTIYVIKNYAMEGEEQITVDDERNIMLTSETNCFFTVSNAVRSTGDPSSDEFGLFVVGDGSITLTNMVFLSGDEGAQLDYSRFCTVEGGTFTVGEGAVVSNYFSGAFRGTYGAVGLMGGIVDGTAANSQSVPAVKAEGDARVLIGGDAKVTGNWGVIAPQNSLELVADFSGSIGVSNPEGPAVAGWQFGVNANAYQGCEHFFSSEDPALEPVSIDGYLYWKDENGYGDFVPVCRILQCLYTKLEYGEEAAKNGDTIVLLTNIVQMAYLPTVKKFTLDGDGYTISRGFDGIVFETGDGGEVRTENIVFDAGFESTVTGQFFHVEAGGGLTFGPGTVCRNQHRTGSGSGDATDSIDDVRGGLVLVDGGSTRGAYLTMLDGAVISNCTVVGENADGGAVALFGKAVFNMEGGLITDCSAERAGGAVRVGGFNTLAEMNVTGGTITGCSAGTDGGAVYLRGKLNVSGDPEISGNTAGTAENNVRCEQNQSYGSHAPLHILLTGDFAGHIGVSIVGAAPGQQFGLLGPDFTEETAPAGAENFTCDTDATLYGVAYDKLYWHSVNQVTYTAAGYEGVYDGASHGIRVTPLVPNNAEIKYSVGAEEFTTTARAFTDVTETTVRFALEHRFYHAVTNSRTVVITPRLLTVSWPAQKRYQYLEGKVWRHPPTLGNIVAGDEVVADVTDHEHDECGEYNANFPSVSGAQAHNYMLPGEGLDDDWSIQAYTATLNPANEYPWTGSAIDPTADLRVWYGEEEVTADFVVEYRDNVEITAGARMIVTGLGDTPFCFTNRFHISGYYEDHYENGVLKEHRKIGCVSGTAVSCDTACDRHTDCVIDTQTSSIDGTVRKCDHEDGVLTIWLRWETDVVGTSVLLPKSPDGVPDKYQKEIVFKTVNGYWNGESNGADKFRYVTLFDGALWSENGLGSLAEEQIPDVGANPLEGYAAGGVWWPQTPAKELVIGRTTLPVFAYAYNKATASGRHSAGGGTETPELEGRLRLSSFTVGDGIISGTVDMSLYDGVEPYQTLPTRGVWLKVVGKSSLVDSTWRELGDVQVGENGEWELELNGSETFFQVIAR